MINLNRVAHEIKTVGLYDLILQDVCKISSNTKVNEKKILEVMEENPQLLKEYMQTNVEYNLSNIHLRDINLNDLKDDCKFKAKTVNKNLSHLRKIEKYTLDFEQSSTLVIIFSIEFFVLFSVQYFIVLLDLKEWQLWIYGLFASSVFFAWLYARKQRKLYATNKKIYDEKYNDTLNLIHELEDTHCITKNELLIDKCEEHV
ncbi:MAG: hypothetical protein NTZ60_09195 [Campylobacterales bacterium]|nr:hypothetical protein [Campylobacterales bacterium]